MTRILLIRHGATAMLGKQIAGRMNGVPLTNPGYQQAHELARRIGGEPVRTVYSSPQERTRETARILAQSFGTNVEILQALDEIDFGDWTGCLFEDMQSVPQWRNYNRVRSCTRIPNGEHILEVQARIVGCIERLRARHPDGSIAIVTHGDVIRAALAHYLAFPLDFMTRLEVSPGSMTIVEISEHGPWIRCINNREPFCQL